MKLSCLQENLNKGLNTVGRAVATRSTLPITQNVLIQCDESRIKLTATNLELAISTWIGAKIDQEGSVTVPARLLSEFVGSLEKSQVDISSSGAGHTLDIQSERFQARINGTDASEFPPIPSVEGGLVVEVDPKALKAATHQVTLAAATEDSRPVLTGVRLELEDDEFILAAADGFRLAVHKGKMLTSVAAPVQVIVPAKTLIEVNRILADQEEPVEIRLIPDGAQILFKLKDVEIISQLVQGTFPNYAQLIPQNSTTRANVRVSDFLRATRATSIFARDGSSIVRLHVQPGNPGTLRVLARAEEVGENTGELDAQVEGDEAKIAFNFKYLLDLLNVIDSEEIVLELNSPSSPGVLRPLSSVDYVHVIMPMFVQW